MRGLRRGPTPTTTTWQLLPLNVQPWLIRLNQLLFHRRPQHRQGFHPHVDVRRTKSRRLQRCFRHQLLLPSPYLVLTKPLRLDIQCQRGASVKIGWKYLDD